jgi:GT2 family glycosyltransferase
MVTRLRVGIVSWNTAQLLDRCLASLPAALEGVEAEIVVVDNASSDDSPLVAGSHPNVRLQRNTENVGYARAMNQALGGASADVLVALNPDTEVGPGVLAGLSRRLLEQPGVGLVAPRLRDVDGNLQHSVYRFPTLAHAALLCFVPPALLRLTGCGPRWWLEGHSPHNRPADIDWAIGAVHVLRADAVDPVRPYSERWFMYVEDLDLCWRLSRAGWRRRFEPDFEVVHVGNAAGAQAWGSMRTERWLTASHDWYAEARGEPAMRAWAAINGAGVAWMAIRHGVPGLIAPRRSPQSRTLARQFGRLARLHARVAFRGRPRIDPLPAEVAAVKAREEASRADG